MNSSSFGKGIFFAASAYVLWGILPMYWKLISAVSSLHLICFRILFSFLLVSGILFAQKNISWLGFFGSRRKGFLLVLEAFAISFNWGLYIWAVNGGHIIETSLGNYMSPVISIVLGLCFFREKLKLLQWFAFALVIAGVLILTVFTGAPPWVSLGLAFSFSLYGLLKKNVSLTALESLGAETLIASPFCLLLLFMPLGTTQGSVFPDWQGLFYLTELPVHTLVLFLLCGAVTTLPMYLFSKGAKMLPLSTLGFVQYVNPTLTFLSGVFVFREAFPLKNLIAYGCIWTAVILYVISLKFTPRRR